MFSLLDRLGQNDSVVKAIFDHLRDFGLCCLLLGAALWKVRNVGSGWQAAWDYGTILILIMSAHVLMWINNENLISKIVPKGASFWAKVVFLFIYAAVLVEILGFMAASHSRV